jgi:REP element-mobilizing transposase RayT
LALEPFSTKDRIGYLDDSVRAKMHAYLASCSRSLGCFCFEVGGTEDHVHIAVSLPRTLTISKMVEEIKVGSSAWIKKEEPSLSCFSWQRGYAAISFSPSDSAPVVRYIERQIEHHRQVSFMDEYKAILEQAGIEYDPRYMFD